MREQTDLKAFKAKEMMKLNKVEVAQEKEGSGQGKEGMEKEGVEKEDKDNDQFDQEQPALTIDEGKNLNDNCNVAL